MAEQLINIGFGKESFTANSASLSAFVVTDGFNRVLPNKVFKRQGNVQRFPASNYPDINGYLYLDSLLIPDGTILCLQAQHRHRGSPLRDGAIFLRTRSSGPMVVIHAHLPSAIESTIQGDFIVFQGKADVLTLDELEMHGVTPHKNYINGFLDHEEVAECYTISQLAPGTEAKPTFDKVEDREGKVVLTKKRPGRKLSLRRPS